MSRLRLVPRAPDTPAVGVRKRARAAAVKCRPYCGTCGGAEYIVARTGNVSAKLCLGCLTQGRRREMTPPG